MTTTNQESADESAFEVIIAASAPTIDATLVHAVTVCQPVQTWTVIRSYQEFLSMQENLLQTLPGVPRCPQQRSVDGDLNSVITSRHELQSWLSQILSFPGARESPVVSDFLTRDCNLIPPQYEHVGWTIFNANGEVAALAPTTPSTPAVQAAPASGGLDDMMMDDLFYDQNDTAQNGSFEDDDGRPFERYTQTDEPITEEDEREFSSEMAGIEMIEDVGSLAQSMGATHLGRSLQRQVELAGSQQSSTQTSQAGLQLAETVGGGGVGRSGGLGSAMTNSVVGLASSFSRTNPQSPPRLDAFKMVKVIGKGSFGKVFLVREIRTGHMFAMKVLKKDHIINRNQVEHTRTERSVLGYVAHPYIVGMKMAFQSKSKLYFVLDYCAGGELFFHLERLVKFPEQRARFYAAEIVLAISYVHSLDIIYRDLKPENVLLDANGHIRLTDFGLSKEGISSSSSGANSFCGTPEYLAPEILNRQGHGRGVDWWSLGALLYEMLTGLPPFYCKERPRLFENIKNSELQYPPSLSPEAKNLLQGLLTKDPMKRLGSGQSDVEDIKRHPFFNSIDWEKLQRGEVTAPWRPQISGNNDTSQFDSHFTSMPFSPESVRAAPGFAGGRSIDETFAGFSFQNRCFHGAGANGTPA